MPGAPAFVDTNVLLHASRPNAAEHARAQAALSRLREEGAPLWLSQQVLREHQRNPPDLRDAAATRPQASGPALPMTVAIADVLSFRAAFNLAADGPQVLDRLLRLLAAYPGSGKQVHDANIVATLLEHRITRLLTFNAADFRRFAPVIAVIAP